MTAQRLEPAGRHTPGDRGWSVVLKAERWLQSRIGGCGVVASDDDRGSSRR